MQGEIDERVPRGGHSLMTVFGLPGAGLGLLFYLVVESLVDGDHERLGVALMVGIAFGAATYLLTVLRGQVIRASITGALIGAASAALAWVSFDGQAFEMSDSVLPVLAWGTVLTVALPFIRAASKGNSFFDYRPLYADAWTLPAIVGVSQAFVLVGTLLAFLVAALFAFIGLSFLRDLMGEPWFFMTYGGLLQAVGVGVVRQREEAVLAVRGIKMALIRVTAPVFAACATIFVGAVMIRGFGSLMDGLSPVVTLTATAAVAIIMINAIVADEGRPQNALFGATSRLLGVILLFLMALAVYGLYMRVAAEGWTPNRIAAAVAVGIFALYAPIYAAAALAERWSILRQGNIAMSAVLVLVAVFICVPLFRPFDWSVTSQLAKFEAAPEEVTLRDLAYLRDDLGAQGEAAFAALGEGEGRLAELARELGDRPTYSIRSSEPEDTVTEVTIVPEDWQLPEGLREAGLRHTAIGEDVIFNQLPDGSALATVLGPYEITVHWMVQDKNGWQSRSEDSLYVSDVERDAFIDAVRAGDVGQEVRTFKVITVGNRTVPDVADRLDPFRVDEGLGEAEDPAN